MKQMRSIVGVLLVITLIATGCASGTSEENPKNEENTGATNQTKASTGEGGTDEKYAEHYDINIGLWVSAAMGNDEIAEYINEKFNVTLNFEDLSWADYIQKLNIAASSGTLPDMFVHPAYSDINLRPIFYQWADQGIIKALPNDLSAYPNIEKIMGEYEFMKRNDTHYFIPRIAWQPENAFVSQALWVRKDWMENLGLDMPKNDDEFFAILKAFTYDDPDGNGKDDTYGIGRGVTEFWIQNMYQIQADAWIVEDGQYIHGMLSKKNIDIIKFFKRMQEAGVIDPDYVALSAEQGMDKFKAGDVGFFCATSEAYHFEAVMKDMMAIDPSVEIEDIDVVEPFGSIAYGDPITNGYDNFWSGTLFNEALDDKKMQRCLEIYDFLLSEEGFELGRFGIENVHFEKDSEGNYVSLVPADEESGEAQALATYQPTAAIKALVSWDVDGRWLDPTMDQRYVELEKKSHDVIVKYNRDIDPLTRYISTPESDALQIGDLYSEMIYTGFLTDDDPEEHFNEYLINAMEYNGGKEAVEAYNAEAERLGIGVNNKK